MKVGFVSLGCSKNLIDTEIAIGIFKSKKYNIVNDEAQADIIVINTCGFIESAKEEAINTILEMAEYKKRRCKAVETQFLCLLCRLKEPDLVALAAAVCDILRHSPDERPQGIVILLDQGQVDGLGILPEAVAPGAVLGKGMDIGVVPETADIKPLSAKRVDTLIGTGGAADVQKCFHRKLPKKSIFLLL